VEVIFEAGNSSPLQLHCDHEGFFEGFMEGVGHGAVYRYQLDRAACVPDPYSRSQPAGPHGPSMVIDPGRYHWNDAEWRGLDPQRQVIYELHIGVFTPEGTFEAAAAHLGNLKQLGVTALELMPVAEFAGERGWGYDGVLFYAPYHGYGEPDSFRRFVDQAHAVGLGIILDVVYNHCGEDGNYFESFSRDYFTDKHDTGWGKTFNYGSEPVRRFAVDNAAYWIQEFHLDGLRLDATQGIHDPQHPTLLASLVKAARAAAGSRRIVISGEDYLQRAHLLFDEQGGGAGLDHLWNDDFHHACRVAVTGNRGGYFCNYRGHAQELSASSCRGFLFQGQWDDWAESPRGEPTASLPASAFVAFTQNHDQVANTLFGQRLPQLTSPGRCRALNGFLLLGPHTPLIFMGQEFDASQPFPYFAATQGAGAATLWENRKKETADFEQYRDKAAQELILDPLAPGTARLAVLDFEERVSHARSYRLFEEALHLRHTDEVLGQRPQVEVERAILGEQAFLLRWYDREHGDRLLIVNLGPVLERAAFAEPLLAPPRGRHWKLRWCSDDPRYGGLGVVAPIQSNRIQLAAECTTLLIATSEPASQRAHNAGTPVTLA